MCPSTTKGKRLFQNYIIQSDYFLLQRNFRDILRLFVIKHESVAYTARHIAKRSLLSLFNVGVQSLPLPDTISRQLYCNGD